VVGHHVAATVYFHNTDHAAAVLADGFGTRHPSMANELQRWIMDHQLDNGDLTVATSRMAGSFADHASGQEADSRRGPPAMGDSPVSGQGTGGAMSAESIAIEWIAAYGSHDAERQRALLADDAVEEHLDVITATGADQIVTNLQALTTTYSDLRVDDCQIVASGPDHVVYRGIVRGTHTGELLLPGGVSYPPSGNKVGAHFLALMEVQDERISRMAVAYNAGLLFAQIQGTAKAL
jgi:hypothetical protein